MQLGSTLFSTIMPFCSQSGLEEELDAAVARGDMSEAEKISDRLASRQVWSNSLGLDQVPVCDNIET